MSHCMGIETYRQTCQGRDFKFILKQIIPQTQNECLGNVGKYFINIGTRHFIIKKTHTVGYNKKEKKGEFGFS